MLEPGSERGCGAGLFPLPEALLSWSSRTQPCPWPCFSSLPANVLCHSFCSPGLASSCWIALFCVCHGSGARFLLLGIPEASLLPSAPAFISCSAWHCWGNRSSCAVPHVGGFLSLRRAGVYFFTSPSLLFRCLKLSMLFPVCWPKGCQEGCRLYYFPSVREEPR